MGKPRHANPVGRVQLGGQDLRSRPAWTRCAPCIRAFPVSTPHGVGPRQLVRCQLEPLSRQASPAAAPSGAWNAQVAS